MKGAMDPSKRCHEPHYLDTVEHFLNLKNKTRSPSTHKGFDFKIHVKHSAGSIDVKDYIQKPLTTHKTNLK